jgi:hypothetical protein
LVWQHFADPRTERCVRSNCEIFAFGRTIYDEKFGEENDAKDCPLWRGDNSGVASHCAILIFTVHYNVAQAQDNPKKQNCSCVSLRQRN